MDPRDASSTQTQSVVPAGMPGSRTRPALVAAGAILLYLLLIDAAVETFWSGAAVRWWVLGTVVLYFGVTAAAWRAWPRDWPRLGWSGRATATAFVLLGLLALTARTRGGSGDGLRLLGLTTSTVLSLAVAGGIVSSCIAVARLRSLPSWAGWMVGAIGAYGVAAFAIGIADGTPLDRLLHGGSFWTALPSWLQGAVVGSLVLAAGALVQLHRAARLPWRVAAFGPPARQLLALALCASLVLPTGAGGVIPGRGGSGTDRAAQAGGSIVSPLQAAGDRFGEAVVGGTTPLRPSQAADRLDFLFDALVAGHRDLPRDTFDPHAMVELAGRDPAAVHRWVRENTQLVPYRGVLRGPVGVLMDRMGNSLDRSLLLVEGLRLAGHQAVLAHGTLSVDAANTLVEQMSARPGRTAPAGPPAEVGGGLDGYAARFNLDPAVVKASTRALLDQSAAVSMALRTRAEQQTKVILDALGRHDSGTNDRESVNALRDHWWVRLGSGSAWTDLDPSVADVGGSLTTPTEVVELGTLDAALFHSVEIRVVVERWSGGRFVESCALKHRLRPMDLAGQSLRLFHVPLHWPANLNLLTEQDPAGRLRTELVGETEWLPMIEVGRTAIKESSFNDTGRINTRPTMGPNGAAAIGRSLGGMFGGLAGGGEPADADTGVLTAEWIDYEVVSPGNTPRRERRQVFDLVGPAARSAGSWAGPGGMENRRLQRALAITSELEILPGAWHVSSAFVAHVAATALENSRQALVGLAAASEDRVRDLAARADLRTGMPSPLHVLALLRSQYALTSGATFLERPNIVARRTGLGVGAGGRFVAREQFDIVVNDVGVLPRRSSDPFLERLRQGVFDTNAEAIIGAANPLVRGERIVNASEALANCIARSRPPRVVRDPRDAGLRSLRLDQDARARIQRDLTQGQVAAIPADDSSLGATWFRIDSRTGRALGIGADGSGQAASEYGEVVVILVHSLGCLGLSATLDDEAFRKAFGGCIIGSDMTAAGFAVRLLMPSYLAFAAVVLEICGAIVLVMMGVFIHLAH
jgi:hypothetical protein